MQSINNRFFLHGFFAVISFLFSGCTSDRSVSQDNVAADHILSNVILTDIAEDAGIDFIHDNGMAGDMHFVEIMGGGCAMLDYDNDGDQDIYLIQGHPIANENPSPDIFFDRLYRNDLQIMPDGTRNLHFTDVTEGSGLRGTGYGMGIATGDYDNNGYIDLYITNWGSNQLWQNNGDGTFTDVTEESGTDDPRWSTSASFVDFDLDGWLDLMVVNFTDFRLENDHPCYSTVSERREFCGPKSYEPGSDRLYRNRGDGTFEDISFQMGIASLVGSGLGISVADFNRDGWQDIFVANDMMENFLWINQEGRRFSEQAVMAGTAVNAMGASEASMGVNATDFDNDGDVDLFMTHLNSESNTFYLNSGQALFADRTRSSGLGRPSWAFNSFGTASLDYDNDGLFDLYIANGEVRTISEQLDRGDPFPLKQPNQLFHNRGNNEFEEVADWGGEFTKIEEVSRGAAFGDIDNDGDSDLLVLNLNGPARLYKNNVGQAKPWIGLRLVDDHGRDAFGALVTLIRSNGNHLWRLCHTDGSYCSSHESRLLFGLGDDAMYERIKVYWPGGDVEEWPNLPTGRYHTLFKGEGQASSPS